MSVEIYFNEFRNGKYYCAECDSLVYLSEDKFKANRGKWATFRKASSDDAIITVEDELFFNEIDIKCRSCNTKLGNLYFDGKDAGDTNENAKDRHVIFSSKVVFKPDNESEEPPKIEDTNEEAKSSVKFTESSEVIIESKPSQRKLRSSRAGDKKQAMPVDQKIAQKSSSSSSYLYWVIGGAVATVGLVSGLYYLNKKRKST